MKLQITSPYSYQVPLGHAYHKFIQCMNLSVHAYVCIVHTTQQASPLVRYSLPNMEVGDLIWMNYEKKTGSVFVLNISEQTKIVFGTHLIANYQSSYVQIIISTSYDALVENKI